MDYKMEELIPIVSWLVDKYTSKESTSVSYETAQQLMGAVLYCIKENKGEQQEGYTLTPTGDISAEQAYKSGYDIAVHKVMQTKEIFEQIISDFTGYGNYAYEDTIMHGIPEFFLHYDVRFNPQDHILTLDYPIIVQQNELCGVDRIYQYLSCVRLEQIFLKKLPYTYIVHVLRAVHEDCDKLLINLCSIIFRNIIGRMLIGSVINEDKLTNQELEEIRKMVIASSRQELGERFRYLTKMLVEHKYDGNRELKNYLEHDIGNLVAELTNAAEYNCIETIFL